MNSSEATKVSAVAVRPSQPLRPDASLVRALVLVNGAVPLLLLAYDTWQRHLGANGVNYTLHTTGFFALLFFVLSLVVTPFQKLTGWRELVAGRRWLGLYGFFYLVVHFTIFVVFDRGGSLSSTWHEIVMRRYLQLGSIALLLLVPLAVTSTDRMISRLGPRRWKRLHRLSYVATTLGVIHYILLVKSDIRQPVAFAVVLTGLLGYRAVAGVLDKRKRAQSRPWSGELRVAQIVEETHDVRTFRLVSTAGGALPFKHRAGQYLNLALMIDGKRVNRSYTIASAPTHTDYCEITVKRVQDGYASHFLHKTLEVGSTLKVTAPTGRFVFEGKADGRSPDRVLLLAGGVGITPVMSMLRTLTERSWKGGIDLLFAVQTQNDIVFAKELAAICERYPRVKVCILLSREPEGSDWTGKRGQITRELVAETVPDIQSVPVYICGPGPMMAAMQSLLADLGAPGKNVHLEAFLSPPPVPLAGVAAAGEDAVEEPDDADEAVAPGGAMTIQFAASGTSASVLPGETLLEAAEAAGVEIAFDCRSGICGQCKTQLVKGRVVMDVEDALTPADRKQRLVLACQARPVRNIIVDA